VQNSKQLIVFAGKAAYAINPTDGKTIWSEPWQTQYDVNACTPIYQDEHLFLTSDYGHGCAMFQLTATGKNKLWESKEVMTRFQGVIFDRGFLYANSEGTVKCLAWPGGEVKWAANQPQMKIGMGGSLLRVGDKMICLSDRGKLVLAEATPEKITVISQFEVFKDNEVWATPLIYQGKLYVKGTSELVCLDISGK
jgi:outer membrane protein assembly factor BamB